MPATSSAASSGLHVAHAAVALECGGLERIVVDLARRSRQQGRKASVICLEYPGVLAAELEALGVNIVALGKQPGVRPEIIDKAADAISKLRPDVIHTHHTGTLWYVGAAAQRLGGPPVLHTEHIDNVAKAVGFQRKLRNRILWHRAAKFTSRFCCVSPDIARSVGRFGTVPSRKLDVVLNGIDVDRFAQRKARNSTRNQFNIPAEAIVIGNVARLHEVKSHDLLIRAFARLAPDFPALHLLIVGDGEERRNLEKLASDLGVQSRTVFAGYQSQTEDFLAAMDLFSLPSRMEGLPLAMLEAWASQLPVVCSAVGGIPKVVESGRTGLLFPSGDLSALETAMRQILTSPAMGKSLGMAGYELVLREYSLERMASDYDRRYLELLQRI